MQMTYYEWFSFEWAKVCAALNPNKDTVKRLIEIKKQVKGKTSIYKLK